MLEKKFVFAVKLDEFENMHEVFDIFIFTDEYPELLERWANGFKNNDVEVINILNLNPTPKTINIGSFWDGEKFISEKITTSIELNENFTSYAFLDSNKIVFGAHLIKKINQFYNEKWQAAMTSKVVGIDATDYPEVNLGYLWDGNTFYPPENY